MGLGGCAQVADVMGYDTQTLNASAAKSYSQMMGQAKSEGVIETNTPNCIMMIHNNFFLAHYCAEITATWQTICVSLL